MKPPPPVTATYTAALSRAPAGPSLAPDPYAARHRAAATGPGLSAREPLVHRGKGGQHLIDLRVAHVRVHRQAHVPASDLLGNGQRRPSVLRKHRLLVQGQVINLTGQPDAEAQRHVLLDGGAVGPGWQQHDVLVDVAAAAGRLGQRGEPVQAEPPGSRGNVYKYIVLL